MPAAKLSDTWIINNGVAVRFDKTIIREGSNQSIRNPADLKSVRDRANLSPDFPLPLNGKYDRFSIILDECLKGIRHPILLHFKVEDSPRIMNGESSPRTRVSLPAFKVQGTGNNTVYGYVQVKDQNAFAQIKQGQEYFAIVHPYAFKEAEANGAYNLHFDVLRASDIIQLTQEELIVAIRKTSERREAQALKKASSMNLTDSTPS
jgi:hypothetical protein